MRDPRKVQRAGRAVMNVLARRGSGLTTMELASSARLPLPVLRTVLAGLVMEGRLQRSLSAGASGPKPFVYTLR